MYLLDTNILLELLLKRQRFEDVEKFMRQTPRENLNISDFALFSLGIALFRRKMHGIFSKVVEDLLINGGLGIVRLDAEDIDKISQISMRFGLDYDDAYQCVAAEKHNLIIVSFDRHFDRTDRGRRTPEDILQGS
ncbi:MAG: PIN domain-containing protein [Methanothrix sp.]|nr:PIN domain-containing protein [Methanothrix sp.]